MPDEVAIVAAQLGRPVRGDSAVVGRCRLGLPVVIRVSPLLEDGTPFPTLYWLSCPLARLRIGRLEAAGGVSTWSERIRDNDGLRTEMEAAHQAYQDERDAMLSEETDTPVPRGGVGGSSKATGVKCLHAHYAHTLGGGVNPIGREVQNLVEPLDCSVPCVAHNRRNPEWREP